MSRSAAHAIPYAFAREHGVVAMADEGANAFIALSPTATLDAIAEARRVLGKPLRTERVSAEQFAQLLARAYANSANKSNDDSDGSAARDAHGTGNATRGVQPAAQKTAFASEKILKDDLLESSADDGPAVQAVNQLLVVALNAGASDIHIEPYENMAGVRFRIDGQLRDVPPPLGDITAIHAAIVARLKVMARLDLAERRLPQDGRISVQLGGRAVDVRISTLPNAFGERVVLRLLDKTSARLELTSLGLSDAMRQQLRELLHAPHGIVLVTGPTGSGKTTTLYAALGEIATRERNVMTVEDPVEYAVPGIAQTAVHPAIGLTFARSLRSILRQDPDVIMIGEIRDAETAQIAVQASLTGHLVLATLHTNDAPSALTRLADMGVEPYLLASSLSGVMAQRLVRRLCPHCRTEERVSEKNLGKLREFAPQVRHVFAPNGCEKCGGSGYRGRTGVYELMRVDADVRARIHEGAQQSALMHAAKQSGWQPLAADAVRWLNDGTTSLAEVLRVTADAS